ncbi:Undefined function [Listeria monocytogenes]|nr:Undefined function [Listeria monocytogenes]
MKVGYGLLTAFYTHPGEDTVFVSEIWVDKGQ